MARGIRIGLTVLLLLSIGVLLSGTALAVEIKPDVYVTADVKNLSRGFLDPGIPAVAHVKSGQIVKMDTVSVVSWPSGTTTSPEAVAAYLASWGIGPDNPIVKQIQDAVKLPNGGHILTGPIYVDDAVPGDVLEIRFLDIQPRTPFGNNSESAGGKLNLTVPGVARHSGNIPFKLDLNRMVGSPITAPSVEIPLHPFMGTFGLATATKSPITPPYPSGGNTDDKNFSAGTTVYYPVQVPGGLIFTGDAHANQGDGEISNTGIECSMSVTFQVVLQKTKNLHCFMAENATHYIIEGLGADADEAYRMCLQESIDFLCWQKELSPYEALAVLSCGCDFGITQYANQPVVGMHCYIPKSYFVNEKNTFWALTHPWPGEVVAPAAPAVSK